MNARRTGTMLLSVAPTAVDHGLHAATSLNSR
jgi:hypothetical protein